MAVINTGLVLEGANAAFSERLGQVTTHFQDLSTRIPSTSDSEKYRWLGSLPRMREWGTGRLSRGIRGESYNVENLKYESTIEVDRDEIADDKTGAIRIRIQEMSENAATHKDFLIGQLLANGATAGFLAYDGKVFFADDHESGASGVQDNKLTSPAVDPANPTTAEFKAAIQAGISRMLGFKNDVGDPANLSADGIVAVVPTGHMFPSAEALNATIINNTSNVLAGSARQLVFPWLTATDTFYLLKNDGVIRPFIFQDREPIEFKALDLDSETGFEKEIFKFGVRARYAMTYAEWRKAVSMQFV